MGDENCLSNAVQALSISGFVNPPEIAAKDFELLLPSKKLISPRNKLS
jgi:hypothetical protein